MGMLSALIEDTVSTMETTSGYFLSTSPISKSGLMVPVEVSLWMRVMASYLPVARAASTISGVIGCPHSALKASASLPQARVTLCHLSEKAPLQKFAQRLPTRLRTAPSMAPKALEVERNTLSEVDMSRLSLSVTPLCRRAYSGMRWPIIGVAMAWRISGLTSIGPGIYSFLCM